MGATIDFFLEFDDSNEDPFTMDVDGVIDFTKGISITHCKPYDLMQAIAGVRGDKRIVPLIAPRGFPKNMNRRVKSYLDEFYGLDSDFAGWLRYSELIACIEHAKLKVSNLPESIQVVIQTFEIVKNSYGEQKSRLIFVIESP